ncbi:MAG: hypothetical protein PHU01_15835, partial [Desulfuromonadaceae bacterium]|nr:hypothetical protein [Desulfuromonadaceae bacterium]
TSRFVVAAFCTHAQNWTLFSILVWWDRPLNLQHEGTKPCQKQQNATIWGRVARLNQLIYVLKLSRHQNPVKPVLWNAIV